MCVVAAVALAAVLLCGCGDSAHDRFREVFVERATYGDPFREPPPELTDEQIDEAIRRVCVDGRASLDAADEIGRSLAGGSAGSSALGSAIASAVDAVGCD